MVIKQLYSCMAGHFSSITQRLSPGQIPEYATTDRPRGRCCRCGYKLLKILPNCLICVWPFRTCDCPQKRLGGSCLSDSRKMPPACFRSSAQQLAQTKAQKSVK